MASIYTYRVEDGSDLDPPINAVVFIVTLPNGRDLKGRWQDGKQARAFCEHHNRGIRERGEVDGWLPDSEKGVIN